MPLSYTTINMTCRAKLYEVDTTEETYSDAQEVVWRQALREGRRVAEWHRSSYMNSWGVIILGRVFVKLIYLLYTLFTKKNDVFIFFHRTSCYLLIEDVTHGLFWRGSYRHSSYRRTANHRWGGARRRNPFRKIPPLFSAKGRRSLWKAHLFDNRQKWTVLSN